MSAKPTPTPWDEDGMQIYDAEGRIIASVTGSDFSVDEDGQHAAHIVRCVNAMPAMVEALELCIEFINDAHIVDAQWTWRPIENARAALALAKGE